MDPTEDRNGLTPEEFLEAGPCWQRGQDEEEVAEFQVELLPSLVADAAQRLTRAISLALRAASRGDDSASPTLAHPPTPSNSEKRSHSDSPCP